MTAVSGVRNRRIRSCRVATSASFSAAVGSSMISTLVASLLSALAISTICCLATVSVPTTVRGCRSRPSLASSSAVRRFSSRSSVNTPARLGSRPM